MSVAGQAVWRIAKHAADYAATDLSGSGAEHSGGRWNSVGMPALYAATSIALATLETLVHLGGNISVRNLFLVQIVIPASLWRRREVIQALQLPATWVAEPPASTTIEIGDDWLARLTAAVLLVPSVIVPEEYNVLLNPNHPDAGLLTSSVVRQFVYDPRLQSRAGSIDSPLIAC